MDSKPLGVAKRHQSFARDRRISLSRPIMRANVGSESYRAAFYRKKSGHKRKNRERDCSLSLFLVVKSEFDHYCVMVGGLDAADGLLDDLVADHTDMRGVNEAKVYGRGRNSRCEVVCRR